MPDGKGDYIRKSSTYKPPPSSTPTQARRGADKYAIEFEQKCMGLPSYDENITLDTLFAWYMSNIAPNRIKEQTQDINMRFYTYYIQPTLGRYKLKQISPALLDNAFKEIQISGGKKEFYTLKDINTLQKQLYVVNGTYRKMSSAGIISVSSMTAIANGGKTLKNKAQAIADYCHVPLDCLFAPIKSKPLNLNTIKKIKQTLSSLLSAATQKGIIRFNPMLNTEPIRTSHMTRPVMNIEQARLFLAGLKKLNNISVRALLLTALFTGMRSGELRALQWNDVDIQSCLINVNKNLDGKNRITSPKTKSSFRYVQISLPLARFLEQYRDELQAYIVAMRGRIADNGIVFPSITTGEYMNCSYPNKVIKNLILGTDISQGLHMHSLRHCFTAILINAGADPKLVQTALGHSSITTTQDIYGHIFAETLAKKLQGVSLSLTPGDSIFD